MDTTTHDDVITDEREPAEDDFEDTQESGPQNLLSRLRVRRNDLAEEAATGERELILPIPGYNNELFAKFVYRPDAFDRLKKIGQRAVKSRHPRRELHAAQDTLAYACTEILVSENGGETVEPIAPDGAPVAFGSELPALLGFTAGNARDVVAKVFNNDLAIVAMSNRVSEWMQGEDEEVDEDFSAS